MNAQSMSYTADGTTVVFAFDFPLFEPLELEVVVDGTTQVSGFTILGGEGVNPGGAVRFATAPASGKTVILRRTGQVQVSGTDAPGFLEAKVIAGANVTVTKTTDANGEHLAVAADANPADFLAKVQNLADLPNAATARTNLGLATVAATGSYTDLSNKPTLGSAAALNVGTGANQVVQLDGSAKLPAVDGSQLTNLPSSIGNVTMQAWSTAGTHTYTPTAGTKFAIIEAVGGGGGGAATSTTSIGGPGGGGSYGKGVYTAAQLGSSQTIMIGQGGAAAAANSNSAGNAGGTTSVGSLLTCNGGAAGQLAVMSYGAGAGSGGVINLPGGVGIWNPTILFGNMGGTSAFGHYGPTPGGFLSSVPGAGGPGGYNGGSGVSGGDGIVIITEFS